MEFKDETTYSYYIKMVYEIYYRILVRIPDDFIEKITKYMKIRDKDHYESILEKIKEEYMIEDDEKKAKEKLKLKASELFNFAKEFVQTTFKHFDRKDNSAISFSSE